MRLNKITLENFKGIKAQEIDFQGRNAVIRAENGMGKTTAGPDAFSWLHYGKDSMGRSAFAVRPLDANNELIGGLVVTVEDELLIDGIVKTFRKEQHEIDKKGKYSYPNKYWIDGYPMPEGKYKEAFENIIPENIFKMLTDLDYFNKKLDRLERRAILVEIAGKIGTPPGFGSLLAKLNGHDPDEFKKRLTDSLALLKKEQDNNIVRIDEKQRDLEVYAQTKGDSEVEMQAKRENIQEDIAGLDKERKELLGREKERRELNEKVNVLTSKRSKRESELKNDMSGQQALIEERAILEQEHADKTQELVDLQNDIRQTNTTIESVGNEGAQSLLTLKSIKDEKAKAKAKPEVETCYACGQKLPADKMADNANKRQTALADIEERGNRFKKAINENKAHMLELREKLNELVTGQEAMVAELKESEQAKNKRIAEINEAIKNRPEVDPTTDSQWQALTVEILKVKAEIGEPVSEQLEKIESRKKTAEDELHQINTVLEKADTIKEVEARIIELEARQKELAQLIADVNGELEELMQFKVEQSKMVEAAVNGRFRHVEFKLFDYFQNGEIDDRVCVAMLNGVPYPDMSKGQKIFANNDVINTLGDHFGVEVSRFIDDAGDLTLPIESNSQAIKLVAIFVYKCVSCAKFTHKQFADADKAPDIVKCDYCDANAKRYRELQVEVVKEETSMSEAEDKTIEEKVVA